MTFKIVSVRIEDKLLKRIDQMAELQDRSRAWVINHAMQNYLDHEEWFIQAVEQGIAEANAGKLVSHQEVKQKWNKKIADSMDADRSK